MMQLKLCSMCRGSRQVSPLGGILKQCPQCKGIGQIESSGEIITVKPIKPRLDLIGNDSELIEIGEVDLKSLIDETIGVKPKTRAKRNIVELDS